MENLASRFWRFQNGLSRFREIMSARDALRLMLPGNHSGEVQVHVKSIGRNVVLRRGTSDLWCLQNVLLDGEYETPFQVEPKLIIDAGANIGMATIFFAWKYPRARIVAIEPEVSNFDLLQRNCAGLSNVTLVNAALWPTQQTLAINDSAAEKWAFSVAEASSETERGVVKAVTIPGLLRDLGADYIDLLKLDIEGAERELFKNGAESWLASVGQIIIELHDRLVPGCAAAFYARLRDYPFVQDITGKNIFVSFRGL